MIWDGTPKDSIRVFLENMVASGFMAKDMGMNVTAQQVVSTTLEQIDKIARESYPLAQVMEASDIVLHAEGPGAEHGLPWLSALNWLTQTAEANFRRLFAAVLDLRGADGKTLARGVDMRLSGLAPGSLWIGLKLMPPGADLLPSDADLVRSLVGEMASLPDLARFIDDEGLRPGIEEASPDPAQRDVELAALLSLSPTGKRGIHTLEISSRDSGVASLSQRERVVLREALAKPDARKAIAGSFVGQVREADLDKNRLHLRGVQDVGTLRCVLPALPTDKARHLLGSVVRVTGKYQSDHAGRPRLMFVDNIEAVGQKALNLPL